MLLFTPFKNTFLVLVLFFSVFMYSLIINADADVTPLEQKLSDVKQLLVVQAKSRELDATQLKIYQHELKAQKTQADYKEQHLSKTLQATQRELDYFQQERTEQYKQTTSIKLAKNTLGNLKVQLEDLRVDIYAVKLDLEKEQKITQDLQAQLNFHNDYLIEMYHTQNTQNSAVLTEVKLIDQGIYNKYMAESSHIKDENGVLQITDFQTFNKILSKNNRLVLLSLQSLGQKWLAIQDENTQLYLVQKNSQSQQIVLSKKLASMQGLTQAMEQKLASQNDQLVQANTVLNKKIALLSDKLSGGIKNNQNLTNQNNQLAKNLNNATTELIKLQKNFATQVKNLATFKSDSKFLLVQQEEKDIANMRTIEQLNTEKLNLSNETEAVHKNSVNLLLENQKLKQSKQKLTQALIELQDTSYAMKQRLTAELNQVNSMSSIEKEGLIKELTSSKAELIRQNESLSIEINQIQQKAETQAKEKSTQAQDLSKALAQIEQLKSQQQNNLASHQKSTQQLQTAQNKISTLNQVKTNHESTLRNGQLENAELIRSLKLVQEDKRNIIDERLQLQLSLSNKALELEETQNQLDYANNKMISDRLEITLKYEQKVRTLKASIKTLKQQVANLNIGVVR